MTSVGGFQARVNALGDKISDSIDDLMKAANKTGGDATSEIIKASERNKVVNQTASKVGELINNMRT
jgi:hypothetical protein